MNQRSKYPTPGKRLLFQQAGAPLGLDHKEDGDVDDGVCFGFRFRSTQDKVPALTEEEDRR